MVCYKTKHVTNLTTIALLDIYPREMKTMLTENAHSHPLMGKIIQGISISWNTTQKKRTIDTHNNLDESQENYSE